MARAEQMKALLRAYAGNEDAQFISVALQVAVDEAQRALGQTERNKSGQE